MNIPTLLTHLFDALLQMDLHLEDIRQTLASDILFDPKRLFSLIDSSQQGYITSQDFTTFLTYPIHCTI